MTPTEDGAGSSGTASSDGGGIDGGSGSSSGVAPDLGGGSDDGCAAYDAFAAALPRAADAPAREALLDGFLHDAWRSAHGLPVRCDGRMVVLARKGVEAGTLSVAGDFDAWDPQAHPLAPMVDGFDLWVADIAVDEPRAPSLYKLVRDGTDYAADPWARRYGYDEFGEYSLTDARPGASHHERYPGFDDGIGSLQPRQIVVYVPADALARSGLPVLVMHDGQNLFAPDAPFGGWQVGAAVDAAIAGGELPPLLVVAIDNTDARFDEYSPVPDDLGSGPLGGKADEYADFVAMGVLPFVDARYPTAATASSRATLGSSMGGLVSLYIAWRHPDVIARAGSMSGTLQWGRIGLDNDRILELYQQSPPTDVWLYLDSGGNGPCPGDSDNYCVTVQMRDLLVALGWVQGESMQWLHAPGATHDEAAWAARLPGFLALLGPQLTGG
ncbi:MAG: alpha/beta hydrolase-fold protein [Nannocystaceae bacterium]